MVYVPDPATQEWLGAPQKRGLATRQGPACVPCPGEEVFAAPLIWYGKLDTAKVTTPL
jgi:hypothetical protein